ncbi:MAG: YciI family protein [Pseudomonadota bacterium]
MQYALLFYESPTETARRNSPDAQDYWAAWSQYMEMMRDKGIMRGGNALQPPETKTRVRKDGDTRIIEDGPFAEAREELGGLVVIEVDNIDTALLMAEAAPCARTGHVEVRPILIASDDTAGEAGAP